MNNQFPRGKLNVEDEGALQIAIGVQDKTLIVDFGKPVKWIGLDKQTALSLAEILKRRAEQL